MLNLLKFGSTLNLFYKKDVYKKVEAEIPPTYEVKVKKVTE